MKRGPYRAQAAPGSIAALIRDFRMSPKYRNWAVGTQRHADHVMADLQAGIGREQVASLSLPRIILLRDSMSDYPGAANNWIKVIRALMHYAKRTGYVQVDPFTTERVERLPPKSPGGHRTWRDDEIDAYLARWPIGTFEQRVLTLALYTGAAAVDLVQLGPLNQRDGRIRYRRKKTERRKGIEETPLVDIPILPELAVMLATIPTGTATFLERNGRQMRADYVRQFLRRAVDEAGLGAPDRNGRYLTPHGLRKALGRRLAEAGASPHSIMGWLGHESIASAQVYTRAYDRARAADQGAELLGAAKPTNVTRIKREPRT